MEEPSFLLSGVLYGAFFDAVNERVYIADIFISSSELNAIGEHERSNDACNARFAQFMLRKYVPTAS